MANSTATAKIVLSYFGAMNTSLEAKPNVSALYQAQVSSTIDIPDATSAATSFPVAFGSISDASMVMIYNSGNADLEVTVNSSATPVPLVAGGIFLVGGPTVSGITSVSVETTAEQSGEGKVSTYVFGDPV